MASRCRSTYQQVMDAFARSVAAEPDPVAFRDFTDLLARSIHQSLDRQGISGQVGGYSSWLHCIWADRGGGHAALARKYLELFDEADLLHQAAPSLEALLRALRDPDTIGDLLRRAERARQANLPDHLREGAAIMFGRVSGVVSARGGWFQADIADRIGWNRLRALELKLEAAASVLGVPIEVIAWARRSGVDLSHRLLDILTIPGHLFPSASHPKAGRLLELKAGPELDQAQVWKYLGTFGDLESGSMAGQLRFVVNIPVVPNPREPSEAMLGNLKRIWNGLREPAFLDGHPNADDLLRRLFTALQLDSNPSGIRNTTFGELDTGDVVALQKLVIEMPTDIPVSQTLYRPPGMPGTPGGP